MAEQGQDKQLDVNFFYPDKVKPPNQNEIRSYQFLTYRWQIINF